MPEWEQMSPDSMGSSPWLEPVLAQHLARVPAPDALWNSVRLPRVAAEPRVAPQLRWAAALALTVLALGASLWLRTHPASSLSPSVAIERPAPGPELAFYSQQASEVRSWIQAKTGLDVPMPANPARSIRLIGARIPVAHPQTAQITFESASGPAILEISKSAAPASAARHSVVAQDQSGHVSWTSGNQVFTLACTNPEALHAACALCHV